MTGHHSTVGIVQAALAELNQVRSRLAPGTWGYVRELLQDLEPDLQVSLARSYRSTVEASASEHLAGRLRRSIEFDANSRLREYLQSCRIADLNLSGSDADIRHFCDARVSECSRIVRDASQDEGRALRRLAAVLERYRLAWFAPCSVLEDGPDLRPVFGRVTCKRWWLRNIRRLQKVEMEKAARDRCLVGAGRQVYCSDWNVRRLTKDIHRNRETLSQIEAVNEEGDSFTLDELEERSIANPRLRRAELMVRMRGFDELAGDLGHVGEFWTFTVPSRFHCQSKARSSGIAIPNPKWDGASPQDAQRWLKKKWAQIRAKFDREDIRCYGFRVAEPHHDGTPHWHLLLFFAPDQVSAARRIARHYVWRTDTPGEAGARSHRFEAKTIDTSRGSATGYLAKYVAKNIDGAYLAGLESDEDSNCDMAELSGRVRAWASTWGMRQFQQIGGASVTVWRELRRLDGEAFEAEEGDDALCRAVEAADSSDWAAYVLAMGGPNLPRVDRPLKPAYWVESRPAPGTVLGESPVPMGAVPLGTNPVPVPSDVPNRYQYLIGTSLGESSCQSRPELMPGRRFNEYGELVKGTIFGLWFKGKPILTRFYRWMIRYLPDGRLDLSSSGATAPPWTCVNNCTGRAK